MLYLHYIYRERAGRVVGRGEGEEGVGCQGAELEDMGGAGCRGEVGRRGQMRV